MKKYSVYITPNTFQEIKKLRGNIKHRVRQAINDLSQNPRPSKSKKLKK